MNESDEYVNHFAEAARVFCSWLESDRDDDASERFTALRLLSTLYSTALHLPDIAEDRLPPGGNPSDDNRKLTEEVMNRLDRFPNRYYWRIEKTHGDDREKFEDDIARDLYLTYSGVKSNLLLFDRGGKYRDAAVWSWRFSFWLDWGRHSANAIQALHSQFHEEVNQRE